MIYPNKRISHISKKTHLSKIFNKKNIHYLILAIIIFLSLFIRLYGISNNSLELAEASPVYYGQRSIIKNIINVIFEVHPPLYNTILNIWISFFGISELSVRFLSTIFGILSIFLIFLLGKSMFNKKIGLYSAIILAFSPLHVYLSQQVSRYTLLCLLTLLSFYFYFKVINLRNKLNILFYLIGSSLLIYTHYFAFFIILTQNVWFIILNTYKKKFKDIKRWVLIQFLLFLSFIPWLFIFIMQAWKFISRSWIPKPTINRFLLIFSYFSGTSFAESFEKSNKVLLTLFFLIIVIFLIKEFYYRIIKSKKSKTFNNATLLLLWLLLPLLVSYAYSIYVTPIFEFRCLSISSLAFYILMAAAISKIFKHEFIRILIILFILVYSIFLINNNINLANYEPWKPFSEYLKDNINKDDLVIINKHYISMPFSYYYQKDCFVAENLNDCLNKYYVFPIKNSSELDEIKNILHRPVWLILSHSKFSDKENIYNWMMKNKILKTHTKFKNIDVYYFAPNKPKSTTND